MPFAREADGRISQRFFGAHTFRRTAFAGDYTGLEIQRTLLNRARQLDVPIIDTMYVTRILTRDGVVFGAYGFDTRRPARATWSTPTRWSSPPADTPASGGAPPRDATRTPATRSGSPSPQEPASAIPSWCSSTPRACSSPRTRPGRWCRRPRAARAASCATGSASGSWNATTPSGSSCPPGTGSPSPPTPRSRRAAGRRTAACGSTSRTCPVRRSCSGCRGSTGPCSSSRCSTSPPPRSRSHRPPTTRWAESGSARRTTAPASRACTPSARRPADCTGRTGWAATR